jgi:hypothetical protein
VRVGDDDRVGVYTAAGAVGGGTEEPEKVCGFFGGALGLAWLVYGHFLMPILGYLEIGRVVGSLWVSWRMGKALGEQIAERDAQVLVVVGGSGANISPRVR